ncbi:MAG: HlyD family efflux transporter periplasmic adaptor subunit [Rhizonema sp. NSF051]|nr:HlyD family efflux transporter periplasmic adaptor subunit [Rhizonema sp. NSF051]
MTQLNENSLNGNYRKQNDQPKVNVGSRLLTTETKKSNSREVDFKGYNFEHSVVLRQSPFWSRAIMMTLMASACFGVAWAYLAKIEQVVPATGQLKPEGTVKEIQAPINGVVREVFVKDGQKVKPGDLLLTFDSIASKAELSSLLKVRASLMQENQIYRHLMELGSAEAAERQFMQGNLSKETVFLLKNRAALLAENELFRTELKNSGTGKNLGFDERQRLLATKTELDSRSGAAQMQIEQSKKKASQNLVQISANRASLAIEQNILNRMKNLVDEGGISQLQFLQQKKQVETLTGEVQKSQEEQLRLKYEIAQGQEQLKNAVAVSSKAVVDKIADNKKRMSEIDSQLSKILLENEQHLAENNSKIAQAQLNIKYQEVRAPVAGTVFDLQAKNPGFVANSTQKLLQIVPTDSYIAEAFVTNKDIGFVREGMKVDVRIDTFPFSEFGDIKGEVVSIGSDALPPDQTHQYYRFPAKIHLDRQSLAAEGKNISLQSGMAVTANIKVHEERTVMSLFTEMFTKQIDSIKEVR